tara:strand:- start:206 stop:517 length:312 start_codon:yes stop_codon:yes gene_type:complete
MTKEVKIGDFKKEEILKSKRIFKSATPKYTLDWYIKWIASAFVLMAMSLRGVVGLEMYDLVLSIVGVSLWLVVSLLWKDRALIILNGVGLLFLVKNLITFLVS